MKKMSKEEVLKILQSGEELHDLNGRCTAQMIVGDGAVIRRLFTQTLKAFGRSMGLFPKTLWTLTTHIG
jgi:hypothetical protein